MTSPARIAKAAADARDTGTGWARGLCPVCEERTGKPDKKGSWSISLTTGFWSCWKCSAKGVLRDRNARPLPVEEAPVVEMRLPSGCVALSEGPGATAEVTAPARAYLAGRGLTAETIRTAGILAVPSWGRIIMPIWAPGDLGPELRGWVARAYVPTDKTYLYPKGFSRADTVYNVAALAVRTTVPVMVVEGVFDALAWWPDAVAVLGKPSAWQVDALAAARRPVAVILDGDAWREGWALAMTLRLRGQDAGCVKLPAGMDPDEVEGLREAALDCLTNQIVEV